MRSGELALTLQCWLDTGDSKYILQIDRTLLRLQRRDAGVLCIAMLSVFWSGCDLALEKALQISNPSRERFKGALALDSITRQLCLVHYLKFDGVNAIVRELEALVNQWDVWEELIKGDVVSSSLSSRPWLVGRSHV